MSSGKILLFLESAGKQALNRLGEDNIKMDLRETDYLFNQTDEDRLMC
jgi:hypothetical protein